MKIVINGQTYLAGSKFFVIDTDAHMFPLGTIVTYTGDFEDTIGCYLFAGLSLEGEQIVQLLRLDQIEPLPSPGDPLRVALLGRHFKAFKTVGDLLNGKPPRTYVVQCVNRHYTH